MLVAGMIVALVLAVAALRAMTVVPDDSAYVVERLGRYARTLPAGIHFVPPFTDRVAFRYSLLPKEEELSDVCITLDNIAVSVASTFRWQIVDPQRAAYASASATDFVTGLVRSGQRQWIGERPWRDVRETTRELQQAVLRQATEPAAKAGVKIAAVDVRRIAQAPSS